MATAQHPVPARTAAHHNLDWLWISLSVILVALVAGGVAWAIFRPAVTIPLLPAEVIGFEYGQEATTGHVAQPGVTGEYFGHSGELYAAATLAPSVMGFEYDQEATSGHIASPGVTGQYFGNSGELYAETAVVGSLAGITVDPNAMWGTEFSSPGDLYPAVPSTVSLMGITWDPTALWGAEFSDPAELYPAVAVSVNPLIMGFEYNNEATPGHIASPGVTGQYFGYSGELFPES